MPVADLRHDILLREPTVTTDAAGHPVRTYGDNDMRHYAEAYSPSGDEMLRGEGMEAITQAVFRIRYPFREQLPGVTWQVQWDGVTYEIASVQDRDGRRRFLHLMCKEIQS